LRGSVAWCRSSAGSTATSVATREASAQVDTRSTRRAPPHWYDRLDQLGLCPGLPELCQCGATPRDGGTGQAHRRRHAGGPADCSAFEVLTLAEDCNSWWSLVLRRGLAGQIDTVEWWDRRLRAPDLNLRLTWVQAGGVLSISQCPQKISYGNRCPKVIHSLSNGSMTSERQLAAVTP
jgi:hypothetical protein